MRFNSRGWDIGLSTSYVMQRGPAEPPKRSTSSHARIAHLPLCSRICLARLFRSCPRPAQSSVQRYLSPAAGLEQTFPLRAGPFPAAFGSTLRSPSNIHHRSMFVSSFLLRVPAGEPGKLCMRKGIHQYHQNFCPIWPSKASFEISQPASMRHISIS